MSPSEHHPAHDHERTDVKAPLLGWMALTLVVFLLLTIPMLIGVFKLLKWEDSRDLPERSPLAIVEEPPAPVLQSVPSLELGEYRRQQRKLLGEYQWIDKQQQIVRIPIDQATRLLAERGLPKVPPAAPRRRRGEPARQAGRNEAGCGGVAMKSCRRMLWLIWAVALLARFGNAGIRSIGGRSNVAGPDGRADRQHAQRRRDRPTLGCPGSVGAGVSRRDGSDGSFGGLDARPAGRVVAGLLPLSDAVRRSPQRVLKSSQAVPFVIGKDYDVLTVSFDPQETPSWPRRRRPPSSAVIAARAPSKAGTFWWVTLPRSSDWPRRSVFGIGSTSKFESVRSRGRHCHFDARGTGFALFLRHRLSAERFAVGIGRKWGGQDRLAGRSVSVALLSLRSGLGPLRAGDLTAAQVERPARRCLALGTFLTVMIRAQASHAAFGAAPTAVRRARICFASSFHFCTLQRVDDLNG